MEYLKNMKIKGRLQGAPVYDLTYKSFVYDQFCFIHMTTYIALSLLDFFFLNSFTL